MNTKKILIAEDDNSLRNAMVKMFTKKRFKVLEAKNGEEFLKTALSEHPDIIILDLLMPRKSGIQALRELRLDNWGTKAIVIVVTNLPAGPEKEEASVEGVTDFYTKSDIRLAELVGIVKQRLHI